jgi:beta-galactosidase
MAGTNVSPANNHGRIFGCNNLMGTPKGSVVVNIYKTNGFEGHERTPSNKLDNIDDNQHSYEVQAVYGNGPEVKVNTQKPKRLKEKPLTPSLLSLISTIKPQVFRAPTDNDKSFGNWLAKDWKRCGLDTLTIHMKMEQHGNELTFTFEIPDSLPPLPRLGILIEMPREYEQLTWYGRGPWDNYPDRKVSCPIGLWKSTVSEQYVHYPRPQDSGNHEDCTLVELKDNKGKGIRIEAVDAPFSFSALPYSAQYLASETHDHELNEEGKTFLSIDCAVMGLGNSSC